MYYFLYFLNYNKTQPVLASVSLSYDDSFEELKKFLNNNDPASFALKFEAVEVVEAFEAFEAFEADAAAEAEVDAAAEADIQYGDVCIAYNETFKVTDTQYKKYYNDTVGYAHAPGCCPNVSAYIIKSTTGNVLNIFKMFQDKGMMC
jgi:hypothetical protein